MGTYNLGNKVNGENKNSFEILFASTTDLETPIVRRKIQYWPSIE